MRSTIRFQKDISILATSAVCGKLESQGPLKAFFDLTDEDSKFSMNTWEKAESEMVRRSVELVIKKAKLKQEDVDIAMGGDLVNQCASTTFGIKENKIPFVGLYGACSTFALSMGIAAMSIESGLAETALATASSHFCSAERQYRFPLEYGCQRTPTAQTTVTGSGSVILKKGTHSEIVVTEFLPGIIQDLSITDANNMGAAMAPACCDTLKRYLNEKNVSPDRFDMILSGDLGSEGHSLMKELCLQNQIQLNENYLDCGNLIFDVKKQEVGAGGSGCGCSATVFCSYITSLFHEKKISDVLLIGTGALLNSTTVLQKESIPAIAHLVRIQRRER